MTQQCIIALDVSGKAISAQSEHAAITFYAFLMALFAPADGYCFDGTLQKHSHLSSTFFCFLVSGFMFRYTHIFSKRINLSKDCMIHYCSINL